MTFFLRENAKELELLTLFEVAPQHGQVGQEGTAKIKFRPIQDQNY